MSARRIPEAERRSLTLQVRLNDKELNDLDAIQKHPWHTRSETVRRLIAEAKQAKLNS